MEGAAGVAEGSGVMQPLNYCRQAVKDFTDYISLGLNKSEKLKAVIPMLVASEKFILPHGGIVLDDKEMRAIDVGEEVRLPFDVIALEYPFDNSKFILLSFQDEKFLHIWPFRKEGIGGWNLEAPFILSRTSLVAVRDKDGIGYLMDTYTIDGQKLPFGDSDWHASVLISFLNALACANVRSEVIKGRNKVAKHCKHALPFDDYRILTVGKSSERGQCLGISSNRSPREHLRRGHIVRPNERKPYWRNATVVNPGIGGKILKDYRVTA